MHKKIKKMGFLLGLGAATGYIASLFISEKTKKKHKQIVESTAKELTDFLKDPDKEKRLKQLFPKNKKKAEEIYLAARKNLIASLQDLQESLSEVDKQKYQKLVAQSVKAISQKRKLPQSKLTLLRKYLEADFQLIKNKNKKS